MTTSRAITTTSSLSNAAASPSLAPCSNPPPADPDALEDKEQELVRFVREAEKKMKVVRERKASKEARRKEAEEAARKVAEEEKKKKQVAAWAEEVRRRVALSCTGTKPQRGNPHSFHSSNVPEPPVSLGNLPFLS
ncbi:hypothetical protein F5051DRAFT_446502 [Lentinula edodes]|nr:hypothetical protein F5051DRAFT_446502 [Lentinula edodes]